MKTAHEAMELFNKSMGTAYSTENTHFEFFTPRNGRKIYDDFCSKYFPKRLGGEYRTPGYFKGVRAEAFFGKPVSVIAIRTDVAGSYPFQVHVVLHELSHLYCTEHEIAGGNFYGRYCEDYAETTVEDGIINAGYAIWREAVADMMADHIDPCCAVYSLDEVQADVREELDYILPQNHAAKGAVSRIIEYVMMSRERSAASSWTEFERTLSEAELFPYENFYLLLELVYEQLRKNAYWEIDLDFISNLGNVYISLMGEITFSQMGFA